ncbi:MAG: helix-turn-helix transcriptional regulator [Lactobacillus sp.]|uniref:helix-turn-helix transcriptional regulator n=1 Tax=Lactobacillus TaxID=1578 RepID=UPI0022E8DD8C|nr:MULTISPECIES: helix-turn-helix transcriptional regulator [Lactobacillus]MDE7051035.1 helix-turn-helix transcriptional regulator [Lactobacillus sp.]
MKLTLKALRANNNMTQAEAAKAIGVSEFTWQNYEKGKTYPDVLIIKKIEKAFNVSYSDIIFLPQNTIKS